MNALTEELKTKYHLPKLNLCMQAKRGYHLTIPAKALDTKDFPDEFVQIDEGKKVHRFTTTELAQLNARFDDSLQDIWRLQEFELAALLSVIFRPEVFTALHRLCDSIAVLDMLTSFVSYSSVCHAQTERPRLTKSGPIALQEAYHPTLLSLRPHDTVPNDAFLSETSGLHIITGRNEAGKSTYIRMVGLIAIMAHTGCMVPAKFASVRLLQRLATRFTRVADVTKQQSDFSQEMSDIAAIIHGLMEHDDMGHQTKTRGQSERSPAPSAPPHTLVLIDELGRSTSTLDGFSIAYAVAEYLSSRPNVLTLFTTHFHGLGALATVNPLITSVHLETVACASNQRHGGNDSMSLASRKFTYKVRTGTLGETSYGICTAARAGFPEDIQKTARGLLAKMPVRSINSASTLMSNHFKLSEVDIRQVRKSASIVRLAQRICLIHHSSEDQTQVNRLLLELQAKTRESQQRGGSGGTRMKSANESRVKSQGTANEANTPVERK
eukprot:GFKZ01011611.1.p1 GENE.GFKZ01011611.1~~GFKZ01011611.1.p1  ORF type:complete len:496 (+),score=56.20 GFKZ01011611.1:1220-2707(+)